MDPDSTEHFQAIQTYNHGPRSIEAIIAIHPNYPVQFTLQPRLNSAPPANPDQGLPPELFVKGVSRLTFAFRSTPAPCAPTTLSPSFSWQY
jgi:hypothetical protein